MRVPIHIVDDFTEAHTVVTLKNYYRRRPRLIVDAEQQGLPIYVLRSNTITQMENFLSNFFRIDRHPGAIYDDAYDDRRDLAIRDAESAIAKIQRGLRAVDLAPQSAKLRRMQHQMAKAADLDSHSYGKEPKRYVRIFREQ
jgi:hypothetical protein